MTMTDTIFGELTDYVQAQTNNIWPRENVLDWLIWANENGFLLTVSDGEPDKVIGLMVARPVANPPINRIDDEYDEDGRFLYVDLCIAPNIKAWRGLGLLAVNRFKKQEYVASQRWGGPLKIHDINKARRALFKS